MRGNGRTKGRMAGALMGGSRRRRKRGEARGRRAVGAAGDERRGSAGEAWSQPGPSRQGNVEKVARLPVLYEFFPLYVTW